MYIKFKKWLSGDITWQEERKLRQQAKEDELLADAIEGYDQFPHANHLEKVHLLNKRIRQRTAKTSSALPIRAMAASVILLLSFGAFWYVNSTAFTPTAEQAVHIPITTPNQSKGIALEEVSDVVTEPSLSMTEKPISKELSPPSPKVSTPSLPQPTPKQKKQPEVLSKQLEEEEVYSDPASFAETTSKSYSTAPTDNVSQVQEEVSAESASQAVPLEEQEEAGIIAATMEEKITTNQDISSPSSEDAIAEERTQARSRVSRAPSPVMSPAASPTMLSNQEALQLFIKENVKYPAIAKERGIEGSVSILYQITETGTISNIQILDSLAFGCTEEAVRLLKTVPIHFFSPGIDTFKVQFKKE